MRAIHAGFGFISLAFFGSLLACSGQVEGPSATTNLSLSQGAAPGCKAKLAITDCATEAGYEVSEHTFENASVDAAGRAVYYFGVYEASSYRKHRGGGKASVTDRASNPHTLVLTAYEATHWTIVKAPGSGLQRVITSGYDHQGVTVDPSVAVEDHSGPEVSVCGYAMPYDGEGCDTNAAIATASAWAGANVAQMAGCYDATTFTVDSDCDAPAKADGRDCEHDRPADDGKGDPTHVK